MVDQVNKKELIVPNALECKCSRHERWNYIYLYIQDNQQNALKCQDCVIEDQLSADNLVQLYKIIESNNDTIFQNWPPLEQDKKREIFSDIRIIVDKSNGLESLLEQLDHYFEELKKEVNNQIQSAFKKLTSKVNESFSTESQIINIYNQISKKNELKEIVSTFSENTTEKLEQLQKIIQEKLEQKKNNTELFINSLLEYQLNRPIFNLEIPKQIKRQILSLIDSIEVYECPIQPLDLNQSINRRSECFSFQKTLDDKVKMIMSLISNKSNFCSTQFLNQIEETLKSSKFIFKNISFENVYQENFYSIDFSPLSSSQLQDISLLKDVIQQNQQKYQTQQLPLHQLSNEIQPISCQILQFINKNSSFSQVQQQQFEKLLLRYPIFDGIIEDPMQIIPLKLQLAERDGKQNAQIYQNEFKGWVFQVNQNCYIQAFNPHIIDNNLKYIARVKCYASQKQDHMWVGLVSESERDTLLIYEQNVISFRFCSKSYNKVREVVKGKPLFNQQKIEELEIHFCIKDKYFACSDFSTYENLNKVPLEYHNYFDMNKQYNLAFLMYHQNSRMQLTFFQAVEEFPQI